MALTKYVSAEWIDPVDDMGQRMIKAIGDDGVEYWLPGDDPTGYDVPPWPEFVETAKGQEFLASVDNEPPEAA
jgi:hypothetical protein